MARLSVAEAVAATGGRLLAGDPEAVLSGAAIDSRAVQGGEVFFAFKGERTDGHRFVPDAFARGAAAAVVEDDVAAPRLGALIRVDRTFDALHALARLVRKRVPDKLVAVTGSAGKTTTKELLASMLETRFATARNPGNLNNLYGFPLSLLNLPEGTEWMVAELGMSEPGELGQLSRLGRPDVAVFTVVRPVHLEFFGSLEAIAEAKAEMLTGLDPDGLVVANADDPEVARIARRHAGRVVWYGQTSAADVTARDVTPHLNGRVGTELALTAGTRSIDVRLPLHGTYNVGNFLAAAAAAWAIGIELEDIAAAAARARPAAGRGVVHRLPKGLTLVDDSYNSNPDALKHALAAAGSLPAARHLAVLGDMLELGPEGPRFHRECGVAAVRLGFNVVAGVGELSRELVAAAEEAGATTIWLPSAEAAAAWASEQTRPGDVVLVKASRGVGLDTVVRRLLSTETEGGVG
jgi:UDP-N-acetylmuramoyl-tripeptide--D-alanyl-D-alanine ligase